VNNKLPPRGYPPTKAPGLYWLKYTTHHPVHGLCDVSWTACTRRGAHFPFGFPGVSWSIRSPNEVSVDWGEQMSHFPSLEEAAAAIDDHVEKMTETVRELVDEANRWFTYVDEEEDEEEDD
jgi:hypothetical protein